jgi:putative resolvase
MKLAEWAARNGIHYQTAWRWVRDERMPVPFVKTDSGTILVLDGSSDRDEALGLYARVSSHDQRSDLDRQIARLTQWAAGTGVVVARVEAEVGSGMNGRRPKLRRLLADPSVTTVVVEHRDRLGRMNTELIEAALSAQGRRLMVVDDGEVDDDLVRDMIEVLTSMCARLYGRRGARNRAMRAVTCAKREPAA